MYHFDNNSGKVIIFSHLQKHNRLLYYITFLDFLSSYLK